MGGARGWRGGAGPAAPRPASRPAGRPRSGRRGLAGRRGAAGSRARPWRTCFAAGSTSATSATTPRRTGRRSPSGWPALGLPAGAERVLTSGFVTGRWLRERLPEGAPVLVVGEEGLLRELREAGLDAYARRASARRPRSRGRRGRGRRAAAPAAVVVGMDRSFTYETLAAAQAAIMGGALFVATNRDATFPTPDGLVPGAGAIVAAVATAAEREPVLVGKPGLALAEVLGGGHRGAGGRDPVRGRQAEHRHRHGQGGRHDHGAGAHRGDQRGGPAAGGARRGECGAARPRARRSGGSARAARLCWASSVPRGALPVARAASAAAPAP